MDTALTLAQLAETAAGAEREARAALDAAASEADVAVGAATAGGPGDNVCFDAATVRLLNK